MGQKQPTDLYVHIGGEPDDSFEEDSSFEVDDTPDDSFEQSTPDELANEMQAMSEGRSIIEHFTKAPKFITDPAHEIAAKAAQPTLDDLNHPIRRTLKAFGGGMLEGASEMLSPVNIAQTLLAPESGIVKGANALQGIGGLQEIGKGNILQGGMDLGFAALGMGQRAKKLQKATEAIPEVAPEVIPPGMEIGDRVPGLPEHNTTQFGLHQKDENLPYPLSVVPNRLRPPSTNARVLDALVPDRYKLDAAGNPYPNVELRSNGLAAEAREIARKELMDAVQAGELPNSKTDPKILDSWRDRFKKLWGSETGSLTIKIPKEEARAEFLKSLSEAGDIRKIQQATLSRERSKRLADAMGVKVTNVKDVYTRLGKLKGKMPVEPFWALKSLRAESKRALLKEIENSDLEGYDKIRANIAFAKMIGEFEGNTAAPTKSELKLLGKVFGPEIEEAIMLHGGIGMVSPENMTKAREGINNVLGAARSAQAGGELSPLFRQGLGLIHKKEWRDSFVEMVKFLGAPKVNAEFTQAALSRPGYKFGNDAGLFLNEHGVLTGREESLISDLPERIPVIGQYYKYFNNASNGFLNKLRADTFDNLLKQAEDAGIEISRTYTTSAGQVITEPTDYAKKLASFVNNATGRGDLGIKWLEKMAPELNHAFYSPKYTAAKIQFMDPRKYVEGYGPLKSQIPPQIRQEYLKSALSMVGFGWTLGELGKIAGAEISDNPTSSDFRKLKFGDVRVDPNAGAQQLVVALSRMVKGEVSSSSGGKTQKMAGGYNDPSPWSILDNLRRNRMAPIASFIEDVLRQKDSSGKALVHEDGTYDDGAVGKALATRYVQLFLQDLYDVYESDPDLLPWLVIPAEIGMGTQTYPDKSDPRVLKPLSDLKELQPLR